MTSLSPYEACSDVCGNLEAPGLSLEFTERVDYSQQETTVDQAGIEAELDRRDLTDAWLLHVGVGNSRLAQRFAPRVGRIDGLTVSPNEQAHGESLRIPNYRVLRINKYTRGFLAPGTYDYIIDNNLASFACCKYHFYAMLDGYAQSLKPGGLLLTDQRGMDWVCEDPRWRLSFDDLVALERKFPLRARRWTDSVYSLERVSR